MVISKCADYLGKEVLFWIFFSALRKIFSHICELGG